MRKGVAEHPEFIVDAIDIEGYTQATLALTTTAAQTAALAEGVYDIWCDVDVLLKVAPTADDVAVATGYLLRANVTIPMFIRAGSKIGGILGTGTGTLSFHKVG